MGVLFVHGMGDQPEGDTLSYMGDPFLAWSRDWLAGHGGSSEIMPCNCLPVPAGQTAPQHAHARWKTTGADGNPVHIEIVAAEAWWAKLFDAPSASRISDWIPPLIWGVASRVLLAVTAVVGLACWGIFLFTGENWTTSFPFALALGVALCLVVAILPSALLVTGKLPGALGNASQAFLNFLVLWVGDVLVYQENPRDAFAARTRITDRLTWLGQNARVGEIVVAAHSLGSLLSIDALDEAKDPKVKCLVTFGCPIRLLMKHQPHYFGHLKNLRDQQPKMGWVNFFDPLDLIGGPVDYRQSFPLNVNVDNGCSVIGAHGGYPANLEQFQTGLFRLSLYDPTNGGRPEDNLPPLGRTPEASLSLARMFGKPRRAADLTKPGQRLSGMRQPVPPTPDDDALLAAFKVRWWRFINGTAFLFLSVPAVMGGAYLLSKTSWAKFVADTAQSQKLLPDLIKSLLHDAVEVGSVQQRMVGSLLVCIITTSVLAALVLWIGHLVLFNYQSNAQSALAARDTSTWWQTNARIRLAALWAVWAGTCLWSAAGMIWAGGHNDGRALYLFLPAIAMLAIIAWTVRLRHVRHPKFAMPPHDESARAASVLGVPFFCIEHEHHMPRRPEAEPAI